MGYPYARDPGFFDRQFRETDDEITERQQVARLKKQNDKLRALLKHFMEPEVIERELKK